MPGKMQARLASLPRTETSFIEPMECLSVSRLPESAPWIWEILSGDRNRVRSCLPTTFLFGAEGEDGVDGGSFARGQVAGKESNGEQQKAGGYDG